MSSSGLSERTNNVAWSVGNKKKRNRKRKNKEGKLTAEEIHSMPTDDLCNYIENKAN